MKDKSIYIKLIECLIIIALYHIAGKNSQFLYVITISLYNVFLSCFNHISLKEKLKEYKDNYNKLKLLKHTSISIIIISLIFILLSILISDITNTLLNIKNTFLPYLIMSLSIITEPLMKTFLEYLESYNKPKLSNSLLNVYYIIEKSLFLLISILFISIIRLPINISISLLYLSKIISFIIVSTIIYIIIKKQKLKIIKQKEYEINYKEELKEILKNNTHKSIINIVKNSYYYISIIILYLVLSTRYSYNIEKIEKDITFIYLFGITLIKFIIDVIIYIKKEEEKKENVLTHIYKVFQDMITIAIIIGITSPLICKIIFGSPDNSIYITMLIFLSIFILLFELTFKNIKNNKIIYISLIIGILLKIILIIPFINSFYRMGYNLIYGDIISTILSMSISIIINYIYIKNKRKKEKSLSLEKILTTLYESIILCIILILFQFIIPIKTESYLKSILILIIYISIGIVFIKIKKKRG